MPRSQNHSSGVPLVAGRREKPIIGRVQDVGTLAAEEISSLWLPEFALRFLKAFDEQDAQFFRCARRRTRNRRRRAPTRVRESSAFHVRLRSRRESEISHHTALLRCRVCRHRQLRPFHYGLVTATFNVPVPVPDGSTMIVYWSSMSVCVARLKLLPLVADDVAVDPSGRLSVTVVWPVVLFVIRTVACCPAVPLKVISARWPAVVIVTGIAPPPIVTLLVTSVIVVTRTVTVPVHAELGSTIARYVPAGSSIVSMNTVVDPQHAIEEAIDVLEGFWMCT